MLRSQKNLKRTSKGPQKDLKKTSKGPQKDLKRPQKDLKKTSKGPQKDLKRSSNAPGANAPGVSDSRDMGAFEDLLRSF